MFDLTKTEAWRFIDAETNRARIKELVGQVEKIYAEEFQDIFVSEYREADGRQVIQSLWLFTENYVSEVKNPLTETHFDTTRLHNVVWFDITAENFDLNEPVSNSRLSVQLRFTDTISGNLKASGTNCGELLRIIKGRFLTAMA